MSRRTNLGRGRYRKARPEIFGDGRTVWVNGPDGMNLARFGPLGIDIHKGFEAQVCGEPSCLHCTQGRTGLKEWRAFQTLVRHYYGIGVGDDLMPANIREEFYGKSRQPEEGAPA